MKSSNIICCCKATLQGLLIGDTSVLGKGTSRHACAAAHDTSLPRGIGSQWEWQQWWCHQNRPWHVVPVCAWERRLWEDRWFRRQRSMAAPLQAVHNSQQYGGRTSLAKKKKVHGFTINNETQMAFYTSWLPMQGYFGFSYFTQTFGFSSVNFNLGEIKTTLQKQVNGK